MFDIVRGLKAMEGDSSKDGSDPFTEDNLFLAGESVEISRVFAFIAILVSFVILLEIVLHHIEHAAKKHHKYFEMLNKMYRELMIVGLINIMIRISLSMHWFSHGSKNTTALEIADILIFFIAMSLVLQSLILFWRLRSLNRMMDDLEIMSSAHLLDEIAGINTNTNDEKSQVGEQGYSSFPIKLSSLQKHQIQLKLLRRFFLNTYKLPELFSFSKYIREIQESQITHFIDVDISSWCLLIATYAVFYNCSVSFQNIFYKKIKSQTDEEDVHLIVHWSRVLLFLVFQIVLSFIMIALVQYLKYCIKRILLHAQSKHQTVDYLTILKNIAMQEDDILSSETTTTAIQQMENIADAISANQPPRRYNLFVQHDLFFQLIYSIFSNCVLNSRQKKSKQTLKTEADLKLPFFSRKFIHFFVKLILMVNGLYFAIVLNCVLFITGNSSVSRKFKLSILGLIILPLFSMIFVAPKLVKYFALVNGTWHVHHKTLTNMITYFVQVLEMKQDMISSIQCHLTQSGMNISHIQDELRVLDPNESGYIGIEDLRIVFKKFGYKFARHKFNTFVKLQCKTKGNLVRYTRLIELLTAEEHSAVSIEDKSFVASQHQKSDTTYLSLDQHELQDSFDRLSRLSSSQLNDVRSNTGCKKYLRSASSRMYMQL